MILDPGRLKRDQLEKVNVLSFQEKALRFHTTTSPRKDEQGYQTCLPQYL